MAAYLRAGHHPGVGGGAGYPFPLSCPLGECARNPSQLHSGSRHSSCITLSLLKDDDVTGWDQFRWFQSPLLVLSAYPPRDSHSILVAVIPVSEQSFCSKGLSFYSGGFYFRILPLNPFDIFIADLCNIIQWNPCMSVGITGSYYIQWSIQCLPLFPLGIVFIFYVRLSSPSLVTCFLNWKIPDFSDLTLREGFLKEGIGLVIYISVSLIAFRHSVLS